jgi:hypothetical protein
MAFTADDMWSYVNSGMKEDKLVGIFTESHLDYEIDRRQSSQLSAEQPHLGKRKHFFMSLYKLSSDSFPNDMKKENKNSILKEKLFSGEPFFFRNKSHNQKNKSWDIK